MNGKSLAHMAIRGGEVRKCCPVRGVTIVYFYICRLSALALDGQARSSCPGVACFQEVIGTYVEFGPTQISNVRISKNVIFASIAYMQSNCDIDR